MLAAYPARPVWPDVRRRAASAALAVGVVAAIVLALMGLGVVPTPLRDPPSAPNTFSLSPDEAGTSAPAPPAKADRRRDAAAPPERPAAAARVPKPSVVPAPAPEPPVEDGPIPGMILLDRQAFAGSDIRGKRAADDGGGEAAGAGESVAAYGPGEGPGGRRLYNAEWRREPTDAELAGYLPPGGAPAGSWAVIACRTVEGFQVEDCRSLGESPAGSGLARAMRQAAWQFRVRPPRIGGRTMVGAWVRIRIAFGERP